jgi:hypothetical protein
MMNAAGGGISSNDGSTSPGLRSVRATRPHASNMLAKWDAVRTPIVSSIGSRTQPMFRDGLGRSCDCWSEIADASMHRRRVALNPGLGRQVGRAGQ